MLTHLHPSCLGFACRTSSFIKGSGAPSSEPGPVPEPPSAQSPFARRRCYRGRRDVAHLVGRRYPSFFAHTGSCARPPSSGQLWIASSGRSLQVAVSPCWMMALPDVISAVCLKELGPLPRRVPVDPARLHAPLSAKAYRSKDTGLALESRGSARETVPAMQLQQGGYFGVAVIR